MGWTFEVHGCQLPPQVEIEGHEAGSIWKCPECDSRWKVCTPGEKNYITAVNGMLRIDSFSEGTVSMVAREETVTPKEVVVEEAFPSPRDVSGDPYAIPPNRIDEVEDEVTDERAD